MFINFSNHPSVRWSAEQTAAAMKFGDFVDVPFPDVPAGADTFVCGRGQAPEERRRRSVRVQRAGLLDFRA